MPTTEELQNVYIKALKELGIIETKVDEDDDVVFEIYGMGSLFFSINARDAEYMMLVYPNFASKNSLELEPEQILQAVNLTNGKSKAAKVFMRQSDECRLTVSIECIVAPPDTLPDVEFIKAAFKRNIAALNNAAQNLKIEAAKLTAPRNLQ